MANSWFQFQQFRIHQDRCAMKISTDAVLLGALAQAENPSSILDIGTGTGVIALMLAQRFPQAKITAVELDEDAAVQAGENFQESAFSERLTLIPGRIQDFQSRDRFDLIVSNPPFFPDHLKSADTKRNKALHTDELSFDALLKKVTELLEESGTFWVILPPRQSKSLEDLAQNVSLFLSQKIMIRDSKIKPVHREVSEFTFHKAVKKDKELVLKNENSNYSGEYASLLSGFLLGY
ncbi:tRNA1(Val) (adenine(37)-N6)-methyltransferase [Algoriphagus boritolerans]|uniref:tRNA1(Val) (adenine(37)-N6)-methyltransferase n=1 Tax=Algoriphagus boritolerans DSM 17298 = JCM 18970 TaxID=1120964 RepID=A0A1H5SVA4_9BACT|nr:methyltransferase [Algoriphagus boritolerans]SEF54533.1 tRNA1Val (adenine37-N6)-methyltransferase [Algoriphagus boritolerans DSM 17298 = JCM 18970]